MDNEDVIKQNSSNVPAIVSMVLGIMAVVLCWVPIIGLILSIISIIFAINGLKKARNLNKGNGFSITGISCGAVSIVFNIFFTITWIFAIMAVKYTYEEIDNSFKNEYNTTIRDMYKEYQKNPNILDEYNFYTEDI